MLPHKLSRLLPITFNYITPKLFVVAGCTRLLNCCALCTKLRQLEKVTKENFESYSENIKRWSRPDVTWQTAPVCCITIN